MRLTDLDPRWLTKDGKRIGFMFLSPTGLSKTPRRWQTCFFAPTPGKQQRAAIDVAIGEVSNNERAHVQQCNPDCGWTPAPPLTVESLTFENMSVTPSLDGSAGGNWHGFITNGAIVGGL